MDLGPLNKTTPEESGVVAIETKTNDFPLSAEVVYPRIYSAIKVESHGFTPTDLKYVGR